MARSSNTLILLFFSLCIIFDCCLAAKLLGTCKWGLGLTALETDNVPCNNFKFSPVTRSPLYVCGHAFNSTSILNAFKAAMMVSAGSDTSAAPSITTRNCKLITDFGWSGELLVPGTTLYVTTSGSSTLCGYINREVSHDWVLYISIAGDGTLLVRNFCNEVTAAAQPVGWGVSIWSAGQ